MLLLVATTTVLAQEKTRIVIFDFKAGATKRTKDSFRNVMDKLSKQLDAHLYGYELSKKNNVEEEQSLYFYSIQNSAKWKKAKEICDMLNAQKYMGRNDWRLPTENELQKILINDTLIKQANVKIGKYYLTEVEKSVYKKKRNGEIKHAKNPGGWTGGIIGVIPYIVFPITVPLGIYIGNTRARYLIVSGM